MIYVVIAESLGVFNEHVNDSGERVNRYVGTDKEKALWHIAKINSGEHYTPIVEFWLDGGEVSPPDEIKDQFDKAIFQ